MSLNGRGRFAVDCTALQGACAGSPTGGAIETGLEDETGTAGGWSGARETPPLDADAEMWWWWWWDQV